MRYVGDRISQLDFVLLQKSALFGKPQRHFINLVLQNAQLSLLVIPDIKRVIAAADLAQIPGQLLYFTISPFRKQEAATCKKSSCHESNSGRYERNTRSYNDTSYTDRGHEQQYNLDFPIAQHTNHLPYSLARVRF
ncbi:hypothetical protein D3C77_505200 [compost metagenome]